MIDLSIIIVNYNTADCTMHLLETIRQFEKSLVLELLVVDNNSQDDLGTRVKNNFPEAVFIQMGYNSGFARSNNAALRIARGEYILFLNSDTYLIEEDSFARCIRFLKEQKSRTVLACKLVNPDLSYQISAWLSYPGMLKELRANAFYIWLCRQLNIQNKEHKKLYDAHHKTGEVKWFNAAFTLFHSRLFKEEGLQFDEDIFMYAEDMVWCYRAARLGYNFLYYDQVKVVHLGSYTAPSTEQKSKQVITGIWLFNRKAHGRIYFALMVFVTILNQWIDEWLFRRANKKGKTLTQREIENKDFRRWTLDTVKKYAWTILKKREFAEGKKFLINFYGPD